MTETLHRGLVLRRSRQERGDDVAVGRRSLAPHDHDVAVEDARADHRFTGDPQREMTVAPNEFGRHHDAVLDVLLREDGLTCRDPADQRDRRSLRPSLVRERHGTWLARVLREETLPFEVGQLGVDGRRGGEAHGFADLTDRRRVAALAHGLLDEIEDALLSRSHVRHGA